MPFDNNQWISDLVNNNSLVLTIIEHIKRYEPLKTIMNQNKLFLGHKQQKLKITNQQ